ncbi:MAG: hypothetical protein ABSA49_08705 [Rhizomicrobium sp.]
MRLDFSLIPLKNRAFSEKPMTFVDPETNNFLSAVVELAAIETGSRTAREHWQQKQLQNLLAYCVQRSAFWRKKIGTANIKSVRLSDIPVFTRANLIKQVESEGALIRSNEAGQLTKHATSGSSGTPVQFFISDRNSRYNLARSVAQYFMEGRDLALNRTRLKSRPVPDKIGYVTAQKSHHWLGPLENFVRSGTNKQIEYFNPDVAALCKELERDRIGYLIAQPRIIEVMLQSVEPEFFTAAGTAMLLPVAEALDPRLRDVFSAIGIPVRSSYSSEEVGLIGSECETIAGSYHIATSNVIVEVTGEDRLQLNGKAVGRVLVTHLHSYATPFIRYDIGDVAALGENCACGHDGPVLTNIYGRAKSLLKHPGGRVSTFYVRGKELAAVARFDEFRIRQTDFKNIVVEIGGRESLSPEETAALGTVIRSHAGDEFEIEIRPVVKIAWGNNIKQLGFESEVS